MSKRKSGQQDSSLLPKERNVSANSGKRLWIVGVLLVLILVTAGVFAKNGWFPSTDTLTGKRTGWFGQPLAKNAGSNWNPLAAPLPTPTPQLSKEYIYAGSRLLSVVDANAQEAPPADLAIWRPSTGVWWVLDASGVQQVTQQYGLNGDIPVPGDYDGDGETDFAVVRPDNANQTSTWYIIFTAGGGNQFVFGNNTDIPKPADYDGDGRTDAAFVRPSTLLWNISESSNNGTVVQHQFGLGGDKLCPADFDGDGRADIAVYRGSDTKFYYKSSANLSTPTITFGASGDTPVPADYDGDGRADAAVWRPGVYQWHILYSSNQTTEGFTFGDPASDVYVANDYDSDGKVDRAFWRPSTGDWYIAQSSRRGQPDEMRFVHWGMQGDIPVPVFYRR